jgi:hypothetical protein
MTPDLARSGPPGQPVVRLRQPVINDRPFPGNWATPREQLPGSLDGECRERLTGKACAASTSAAGLIACVAIHFASLPLCYTASYGASRDTNSPAGHTASPDQRAPDEGTELACHSGTSKLSVGRQQAQTDIG